MRLRLLAVFLDVAARIRSDADRAPRELFARELRELDRRPAHANDSSR